MEFKEEILHYIWQLKLLPHQLLTTTGGENISIIQPGFHNDDAGPDFSHATIKIGDTTWAGNVEMHIKSSDWYNHKHDEDEAYKTVILHVVWEHDREVLNTGQPIHTIELKNFIDIEEILRYSRFIQQTAELPCKPWLPEINRFTWSQWIEKLAVQRLEKRFREISKIYTATGNDAEHSLLIMLAGVYGLRVNKAAFVSLISTLPKNVLQKTRHSLVQTEALLFGYAGMLAGKADDGYQQTLQSEFKFLKHKYQLPEPVSLVWKFSRMRPAAFPSLRIAQFAAMYHKHEHLLQKLIETETPEACSALFNVMPGAYWNDHYKLGKASVVKEKPPGKQFTDLLIINSIAPFLFFYGKLTGQEALVSKSLRWLEQTEPEDNRIIRAWKQEGVKAMSAFHSQALIELKSEYCDYHKCLKCSVGHEVMKKVKQ